MELHLPTVMGCYDPSQVCFLVLNNLIQMKYLENAFSFLMVLVADTLENKGMFYYFLACLQLLV